MKKLLCALFLVMFVIGCSGGDDSKDSSGGGGKKASEAKKSSSGYSYDTCTEKAIKMTVKQGVPKDAAEAAAPTQCKICKDDPGGVACKTLIDNLK